MGSNLRCSGPVLAQSCHSLQRLPFPIRPTHCKFEVVLGKVDGVVSFDAVDGKADDVEGIPARLHYSENCLVNSIDPNYSVTFAVNSIGYSPTTSDNLYQYGSLTPDPCPLTPLTG